MDEELPLLGPHIESFEQVKKKLSPLLNSHYSDKKNQENQEALKKPSKAFHVRQF